METIEELWFLLRYLVCLFIYYMNETGMKKYQPKKKSMF